MMFGRIFLGSAALGLVLAGCGGSTSANGSQFSGTPSTFSGNGANVGEGTNGGKAGELAADAIYFSVLDPETNNLQISMVKPSGDGRKPFQTIVYNSETGAGFTAFAPHPTNRGSVFFAYQKGGDASVGIFRNTSLNTEKATVIVKPEYKSVGHLSFSPDGANLFYIAQPKEGPSKLYRVASSGSSAPEAIDEAEQVAVSPVGETLVYVKKVSGKDKLFTRPLTGKAEPKKITGKDDVDASFPAFSRDGGRIVYSANGDLWTSKVDGSDEQRVTSTEKVKETGASFSPDGKAIAFAARGTEDAAKDGLYRVAIDGTGTVLVVPDPTIGDDVYWSAEKGKAAATINVGFRMSLPAKKTVVAKK